MLRGRLGLTAAVLVSGCAPHLYSPDDTDPPAVWVAPENTWPVSAPPDGLTGEGMEVGQTVLDVRGTDQFGDEVSLWQFSGSVVLLDISTLWCSPCQDLARTAEATYQDYRDQGFVYFTDLHENLDGGPCSQDDLNAWAAFPAQNDDPYDLITAPLVSDPKGRSGSIAAVRQGTYPALLVVGRDLKVAKRIDSPSDEAVRAAIEGVLAE